MVQRKVIVRGATNQALDELDAADIPALPYDDAGAADAVASDAEAADAAHAGAADPHAVYQLESGLAAAITATKLDDFAAPDDNTDLNVSTTKHGLTPKLPNDATKFLDGTGAYAVPPGTGLTNPMTTAADLIVGGASGVPARLAKGSDGQVLTVDPTTHLLVWATPTSGGAPTTIDYLVGTADAALSGEIVVGTTPGGELGGTWASPTVDATHSGSTHAAAQAAAEATAAGALSTHDADTTAVHGVADTASLLVMPRPYLPYRTGGTFYYGWWTGAVSTLVLVQNTMYCAPFFVPVATTFTKIGVVSAAVASSQARLGIYSDTAGVPNALVLDAGAVATTAAAFDVITISQALTPGWYWLAAAVQGAAGSLYCNNAGFFANAAVPVLTPGSSFIAGGYSITGITGALPSPWGATKTETARVPNMWLAPA